MKIKITWEEFIEAADVGLRQKGITPLNIPEFYQRNNYEPDSQCYNFPPAYVEVEIGAAPAPAFTPALAPAPAAQEGTA